jgi:LuxR family maltose regulon positive regulatory protein
LKPVPQPPPSPWTSRAGCRGRTADRTLHWPSPFTDREQHVLRYLASTLSNAEIASELYLSVNTVKSHQRMVYRKLGADGRRDAVRRAKELRLL